MKKIILVVIAFFFATIALAQVDTSDKKMFPPDFDTVSDGMQKGNYQYRNPDNYPDTVMNQKSAINYPDGVIMKEGKMWLIKSNKLSLLDHTITMRNGLKVFSDGSYCNTNGIKMKLHEGDYIDMSGKVYPLK